jgi:hypothetical protein
MKHNSPLFTVSIIVAVIIMLSCTSPITPSSTNELIVITSCTPIMQTDTIEGFRLSGNNFSNDLIVMFDKTEMNLFFQTTELIEVRFVTLNTSVDTGSHSITFHKKGTSILGSLYFIRGRDGQNGTNGTNGLNGVNGINGRDGINGANGADGANGEDGLSIKWSGESDSAPPNPKVNQAYYNSKLQVSYIWNGKEWDTLSASIHGIDGTTVNWLGSYPTPPSHPEKNWAYYNTNLQVSFIWNETRWDTLCISIRGNDGASIVWRGSLVSEPQNPIVNWAYYNSANKVSYIYNGIRWDTLSPGIAGAPGESFVWCGEWSGLKRYERNSAVRYNGSAYISKVASINQPPVASPAVWDTLVVRGLQGVQGESGISFNWRGTWNNQTQYHPNDITYHNGSSYIAIIASINKIPSSNPNYWDLFAARGDYIPSPGDNRTAYYISRWVNDSESNIIITASQVPAGFPEIRINNTILSPQFKEVIWWEDPARYSPGATVNYSIIYSGDTLKGYFKIPENISSVKCNNISVFNRNLLMLDSASNYNYTWTSAATPPAFLLSFTSDDPAFIHFTRKVHQGSSIQVNPNLSGAKGMKLLIATVNQADVTQGGVLPNFSSTKSYTYHQISGDPFICNIKVFSAIKPDTFEIDNRGMDAKILPMLVSQERSLTKNDSDWVKITVAAGKTYTIETKGSTDTYMQLFKGDMITQLAYNDDNGEGNNASISWTFNDEGTYYLLIRGYSFSVEGNYLLSLTPTSLKGTLSKIIAEPKERDIVFFNNDKIDFIKNMQKELESFKR